jgi:hypothetical protein
MNISHLSFHNVCDLHQMDTIVPKLIKPNLFNKVKSIISATFKLEPRTLSTLIFDAIESSIQIGFI